MCLGHHRDFAPGNGTDCQPCRVAKLGLWGMAAPNFASDIAWTITRDPNRGIEVHINGADQGSNIAIDLYVIIEYGTRISTVATSVINAVRFSVEKATSMTVEQITVHVQGIRISTDQNI